MSWARTLQPCSATHGWSHWRGPTLLLWTWVTPQPSSASKNRLSLLRLDAAVAPFSSCNTPFIAKCCIDELNPPVLEAAAAAGARCAFYTVMRLPWELNALFQEWLSQHYPDRAARVMARIREMQSAVGVVIPPTPAPRTGRPASPRAGRPAR